MSKHRGDDLDDDFVPDDLVALSGEESNEDVPSVEDSREFLTAGDDQPPERGTNSADADRKRKRKDRNKERKAKVSPIFLCSHQAHEHNRNKS